MHKIAQGAEAVLYQDDKKIIKHRASKAYRHPELDAKLRKERTRKEAKILETLQKLNFPSPKLIKADDKSGKLELEFIDGTTVRTALSTLTKPQQNKLMKDIGKCIAVLHNNNIIHGDLTTSNMMLNLKNKTHQLHFIDFGLSYISLRTEDKAVDLHVLERAFESTHCDYYPELFNLIITEYKKQYKDADAVLARLKKVNERGRYKTKNGS